MADSEIQRPKYPTRVENVPYGKALCADRDLPAGTVVEKFEGKVVEYEDLSDYDKTYVLNFQPKGSTEWKWLLPLSNARYANHSCDPCAYINDNRELVLRRAVREGDQITFLYNPGEDSDWWDPVWNFKCCCGAKQCQGDIDRYRKPTTVN
ncbi:uncharacterized protein SPPG_07225 [Spizellomyces punctatus DAOM BR117]|uniref:SET domain-containing protein n=1 Tax=Spizellomyces punctatus (strain DAOM BR117) TaxID=645134 RepID=A0A0L0H701_SPIPD|nr:uncharacterized protein SPPG_07225 [Spizellomyces punctatus DAOM BR117]KNC97295.1 hypothetical protein SPPG_07225 [Spizellomyces punctatus DAOM BR117]|eukprot:XP_016605335.1 hypothetical protein SPPG_07225 [Spizellomyces punctatus DAOM BR117]